VIHARSPKCSEIPLQRSTGVARIKPTDLFTDSNNFGCSARMNAASAKRESERLLKKLGVTVNESLPTIEEPVDLSPRLAQDVAARAWVLFHVIGVGYGRTGKEMLESLKKAGLEQHLTPGELRFLQQEKYTDRDRAWAAWQSAAVHGCAWALGLVELEPLGGCPDTLASHFASKANPKTAIESAKLRDRSEIYAKADLLYRLHWAARQARLEASPFPLQEIDVQLRRHSLDWIVGVPYEWDDVPLDT
jgi:hypothetical protein